MHSHMNVKSGGQIEGDRSFQKKNKKEHRVFWNGHLMWRRVFQRVPLSQKSIQMDVSIVQLNSTYLD
jgi:hypothetical protein